MTPQPRPRGTITWPSGRSKRQAEGLTSQAVLDLALETVQASVPLPRPAEAQYSPPAIWSVLLYAAAHRTTIEQAGQALVGTPHPNMIRGAVSPLTLEDLERSMNQALGAHLPPGLPDHPREVAIDLKLIPYYGEAQPGEEAFLLTGSAKAGTTRFFGYTTAYVIQRNKRVTLALRAVRRSEGLVGVLKRLLDHVATLGIPICCLYLDRGFYTVEVLRFLLHHDLPFAMAAPKKGKQGRIKGLVEQQGPGLHPYLVRSPRAGEGAVEVAVVGRYLQGRWGKHGRERYAFVVHRFPFALRTLFAKYRRRFGIETSHRVLNQGRARTASRSAAFRLLLVGLALLLANLWVYLKWAVVSLPCRGGRLVLQTWFSFQRFLFFLAAAVARSYGIVEAIIILQGPG